MKIELLQRCTDWFIAGFAVGLGITIFILISFTVTKLYYLEKDTAIQQSISDEAFESVLQQIEGWSE